MQNQKLRAKYVPCESPEGNFFSKVDGWSTRVDYPLQAKAESRRDSVTELVLMMATGMLSSVQFSHSVMSDFVTPWTAGYQASLSITNSQSLLRLMSIESVMPYNHLILCHPLLPSFFPSIRAFPMSQFFTSGGQSTGASASASVLPNEHSGLIPFTINWFDVLMVQRTLKSLLQHHSSKASILQHSAFFMVQLTYIHDYWKNHSFD